MRKSYTTRLEPSRPSNLERLVCASRSSDLTMRWRRLGDVDYLAAAGIVAIRHPAGVAVWRWAYSQDPAEHAPALREAVSVAQRIARQRGWRLYGPRLLDVASEALAVVVQPTCQHCLGRSWLEISGTGRLSDVPCPECEGTGRRRIGGRFAPVVAQALAADLESVVGHMDGWMWRAIG